MSNAEIGKVSRNQNVSFVFKGDQISVSCVQVNEIYLALTSATKKDQLTISVIYIYENFIKMVCGPHLEFRFCLFFYSKNKKENSLIYVAQ